MHSYIPQQFFLAILQPPPPPIFTCFVPPIQNATMRSSTEATFVGLIYTMTAPDMVKTLHDKTDTVHDVEQIVNTDDMNTKRLPEELDGIFDIMRIMFLRIFGAFVILLSIIEFILGGAARNFLNNSKAGSWWAGIIDIVAGYLGLAHEIRRLVTATCMISFLAVIVAAIGAASDGMNFMTIKLLTARSQHR